MLVYEGRKLNNKYLLHKFIKQGGFGGIYLGENVFLHKKVAIKLLQRDLGEEEVEKFRREAEILGQLNHPHIAQVYDFGTENDPPFNGTPYIVMQYAEGGNLRDIHPKHSILPITVVLEYVRQIALALQYAHMNKIIHLDIKPENILVKDDGQLLLCDFGIAIFLSSRQGKLLKNVAGTFPYMAPEQIEENECSPATDQYALGVMVYEWLCGEVPDAGILQLMQDPKSRTVDSLRKMNPAVSRVLDDVVFKALQKDPANRFSSIEDFANALQKAVQQQDSIHKAKHAVSPEVEHQLASPQPVRVEQADVGNIPVGSPSIIKPVNASHQSFPRRTFLELVSGIVIVSAIAELTPKFIQQITRTHVPSYPPVASPSPEPAPPHTDTPRVGTTLYVFDGHTRPVTSLAWAGDQTYIASASQDGTVQVWQSIDKNGSTFGDPRIIYGIRHPINNLAWGRYGLLAYCTDTQVYVSFWEQLSSSSSPNLNLSRSDQIKAIAWLEAPFKDQSNTQYIITVDNAGKIYLNWLDLRRRLYPPVRLSNSSNSGLLAAASSPDGKYFATGGIDTQIYVWELQSTSSANSVTANMIYPLSGHSKPINTIAWSPDGTMIASGSDDTTVKIWNAGNGVFNSNDLSSFTGNSAIQHVAWSPDSKYIASAGADGTVQIWNVMKKEFYYTYQKHSGSVNTVAWSPGKGTMIASGGDDATVQIWASGID